MPDQSFISSPLTRLQRVCHGERNLRPFFGFDFKLGAARLREPVILRAAVVFRFAPERAEPVRFLHAVQCGKERAGLDDKCPLRDLLDAAGDAQTMELSWSKRLENEQIECALEKVGRLRIHVCSLSNDYMSVRLLI